MKKLLALVLFAFALRAAQPGTTPVFAPVAPPAANSNFGGSDSKYQTGGLQEWFQNENDWTNSNILPNGRKRVGMLVSSGSGTFYRLMSTGPDVWSPFNPGSGSLTNGFGLGMTLSNTTLKGWTSVEGIVTNTADWVYNSGSITFAGFSANTILGLNGSKQLVSVAVTPTELLSLQGISGNIQTNLNAKQPTITGAASSITTVNLTADRAMVTDASGKAWQSAVTAAELASLSGTSGNIQTNFNNRPVIQPWGTSGQLALLSGTNGIGGWLTPNEVTNMIYAIVDAAIGNVGGSTNAVYVPTTYYDVNGVVNTNTPAVKTAFYQSYIDLASSLYNTNVGAVRCVFQAGSSTHDQLTLRSHVAYQAVGRFTTWRATDSGSSTTNRSMWYTPRTNGVNIIQSAITHVNGFDSWALPNPDSWYGMASDVQILGPGTFVLNVNSKIITAPLVYLNEIDNWIIQRGAVEVWHGPNTAQWGIRMGGRNIIWDTPIVRNGTFTGQDGLHATHGRNIFVYGAELTSGDDSIALGAENDGGSNICPDEALEDIYIGGAWCDSTRARALIGYSGYNMLQVPYTNGMRVRRVIADGIEGTVAKDSQSGLFFGYYPERDKIYKYTINSAGSGYSDGYYTCAIGNTGGGSGAFAVVRVTSGAIDRAWPYWVSGTTWSNGANYTQSQVVDLAPLGGGTGGSVTAVYNATDNTLVTDIDVHSKLTIGGDNHSDASGQSYGFFVTGASRLRLNSSFNIRESTNTPHHRPLWIQSLQDGVLTLTYNNKCTRGGSIDSGTTGGNVIDNVTFVDGMFDSCDGDGLVKFLGNNGTVRFVRNSFRNINNGKYVFKFVDYESSRYSFTTNVYLEGNSFRAVGASSAMLVLTDATNTASVGYLFMHGNDTGNTTSVPTQAQWNSEVNTWSIYDNTPLYISRKSQVVTFASGDTTKTVTVGTTTGLTGTNESDLRGININLLNNPTTPFATPWWISTNGTLSGFTINVPNAPGASGARFIVDVDTGRRQ